MTKPNSPLAALSIDMDNEPVFEDGDVAVILKANGEVKAISAGLDAKRLRLLDPEDYNDQDRLAAAQGRKLLALVMAAGNPQIMDILYAMIDDPAVAEGLAEMSQTH